MKIYPILFISGILFLASCAKLPVYQSKSYQAKSSLTLNEIADNYDKKSNARYGFANDGTHFYIQAVFQNREHLMQIMRGGLMVYFDPDGKKDKNYQLKIEKSEQFQNDYTAIMNQKENSKSNNKQNMPSMIAQSLNKVTWDKNGKVFVFYHNLQKDPISVDLSATEFGVLTLSVKMPISEIPVNNSNNTISLGIETGKNTGQKMRPGQSGGSGGRMRPGASMGGGMRPAGGMGGGGRGGMGGRPSGAPSSSSGMTPVEIWCKVQL